MIADPNFQAMMKQGGVTQDLDPKNALLKEAFRKAMQGENMPFLEREEPKKPERENYKKISAAAALNDIDPDYKGHNVFNKRIMDRQEAPGLTREAPQAREKKERSPLSFFIYFYFTFIFILLLYFYLYVYPSLRPLTSQFPRYNGQCRPLEKIR